MKTSRDQLMLGIDELMRGIFGSYLRRGRRTSDLDLTLGQMDCLRAISVLGRPSMSELSDWLQLRPSTVTGLVDTLVERGKVARREDATDRRIVRVELTPEGRRDRDRHLRWMRERLLTLLGELGDDDLRKLHEALTVLHAAALRRGEAAV